MTDTLCYIYVPTTKISAEQKLRNQIETVRELVAENPDNEFWRGRLAELELKPEEEKTL